MSDPALLRRYAEERSQPAFTEFVRNHIDLVHAAAIRRLGGDAHGAADVAQQVFMAAARDAARLARHANLSGWLYTATRHAALNHLREARRRQQREQKAQIAGDFPGLLPAAVADTPAEADWTRVRAMLDRTLDELGEADREAVLLRFFEGWSFVEMGPRLKLTENGARMRVDRALDKLRARLAQAGLTSTAATLASALAREGAVVAPAGLTASVASGVFGTVSTGTAATTGALLGTGLTLARLKFTLAFGGSFAAAVAVVSWVAGFNPFSTPTAPAAAAIAVLTQNASQGKMRPKSGTGADISGSPEARTFYDAGIKHIQAQRYDEAHAAFSTAIEIDANYRDAYLRRADMYTLIKRQDYEKAVADYTTALALDPLDTGARHKRAELHRWRLGAPQQAIADYTAIIESSPASKHPSDLTWAYTYRGEIRQETLHDHAAAVADFSAVLRLRPTDYVLLSRRATSHQALKNYAAAEEDFAAGYKIEPSYTQLLAGWAWQLATAPDAQFRDGAAALQLALHANELYSYQHPQHLEALAAAYAENGRFDEAVTTQQRAIVQLLGRSGSPGMNERLAAYTAKQPYRER